MRTQKGKPASGICPSARRLPPSRLHLAARQHEPQLALRGVRPDTLVLGLRTGVGEAVCSACSGSAAIRAVADALNDSADKSPPHSCPADEKRLLDRPLDQCGMPVWSCRVVQLLSWPEPLAHSRFSGRLRPRHGRMAPLLGHGRRAATILSMTELERSSRFPPASAIGLRGCVRVPAAASIFSSCRAHQPGRSH